MQDLDLIGFDDIAEQAEEEVEYPECLQEEDKYIEYIIQKRYGKTAKLR